MNEFDKKFEAGKANDGDNLEPQSGSTDGAEIDGTQTAPREIDDPVKELDSEDQVTQADKDRHPAAASRMRLLAKTALNGSKIRSAVTDTPTPKRRDATVLSFNRFRKK